MAIALSVVGKFNDRDLKKAQDALNKLKKEAQLAASPIARVGDQFTKAGEKMSKVGKDLSKKLTLPIMGIATAAGIAYKQVDEGLDTVAARSGITGQALVGLQDTFKKVAGSATQDMTTVGETVGTLAGRLKLTGKPLEDLSGRILDLSRVTGTDAKSATDAVAKAMTGLGISADKSGAFLDQLLVASQKSGIGVDILAQTLAATGPAFKTMGLGTEDATALIAAFERAGLPTSKMVAGLTKATADFAKKGIKDIPGALQDTITKIKSAGSESKATAIAVNTFGSRAGVALGGAIRSGALNLEDLTKALDGSKGALDRTKKATDGPEEQFKRLKNQFTLAGASLAEAFLPVVEKVVPVVQDLAKKFSNLSPGVKTFIGVVGLSVAALGPLLMVAGNISKAVGGMAKAVQFAGMVQKAFTGETVASAAAQKIAAAATKVWSGVQAAFNLVMSANPIVLVGLAIAALVAGIIIAYKKVGWFHDALDAIGRFLKGTLVAAFNAVKNAVGAVVGFITDHWRGLAQVLLILTGPIGAGIALFWKFKDNVGNVVDAVVGFFKKVPGYIGSAFRTLGDIITAPFRLAFNGIATMWNNTVGKLSFHAPSWIPGIGGKGFDVPDIPMLADGGIIKKATLAMVGEAGPEAVVPLKQYNALVDAARSRALIKMQGNFDGRSLGRSSAPVKAVATKTATEVTTATDKARLSAKQLKQVFSAMSDAGVAALDKIKEHAQTVVDFAGQISSTLTSFGSVTGFDTMGDTPTTGKNVIASMSSRLDQVQKFGEQLKSLAALGLNNASLQEIIAAGPDAGSQIAAALLKDGQDAISQVNTLETQLSNVSSSIGDIGAQSQFGMTGTTARGVVSTQVTIEKGAINLTVGAGADPSTAAYIKTQVETAVHAAFVKASREARNK